MQRPSKNTIFDDDEKSKVIVIILPLLERVLLILLDFSLIYFCCTVCDCQSFESQRNELQLFLVVIIVCYIYLQLLARLLKSKHPEDLQAANRLIKTMVRQVRPIPWANFAGVLKRDQELDVLDSFVFFYLLLLLLYIVLIIFVIYSKCCIMLLLLPCVQLGWNENWKEGQEKYGHRKML